MNASERWARRSEEEKMSKVLDRAMQAIQESILICQLQKMPELEEYIQLNKDMLDWLTDKLGTTGLPLYSGPGKNSASHRLL